MKTSKITLQGQDFVLAAAAGPLLLTHLKDLQRATRFRPGSYRQNVEALRDVLLSERSKTISKARLAAAIQLVGVPDQRAVAESVTQRFPRTKRLAQFVAQKLVSLRARNWRWLLPRLGAVAALLLGINAGLSAVLFLLARPEKSGWTVMQTTLGPVRTWVEPFAGSATEAWPLNWVASFVCSVLLFVLAASLFYLGSKRRMLAIVGVLASVTALSVLWSVQQATMAIPPEARLAPAGSATLLQPRLAYLQQCGDEIPYVFEGQTSGLLFRQLRDEGFQLATPIATRVSNGTVDMQQLCKTYDSLRREHRKTNIVLQNYTREADATLRPYDFADLSDETVTTGYGLFVKSAK